MAFERIKKVGGHEYKYLVENKRINGKVKQKTVKYLGRVDKEPEQFLKLPYGFWYYAQDDCGSCDEKDEAEMILKDLSRISGIDFPDIQYINLSNTKNPLPVFITGTPTVVECSEDGICICKDFMDWSHWKIGRDKARKLWDDYYEEFDEKKKQEIKKDILDGMKSKELIEKHSDKDLIKESRQELKDEKKCKNGICVVS